MAPGCAKTSKGRSDVAVLVRLDDLLHDRRMTLTELAEKVGITLANLSILKTGKARAIRFSTLDALCSALHCQPGDLLEFSSSIRSAEAAPAGDAQEMPL
ncbi:MAG: putative transcriptional regulator [Sphingomonadales bacterium]|nr:putative transcriptional regulator [Sphingomonadales bacterium]